MIFAFYGRRGAGKDTAAKLLKIALFYRASNITKEELHSTENETLFKLLADDGYNLSNRIFSMSVRKPVLADWIVECSFSTRIHEMTSLLTGVPIKACLDRRLKETLIPTGFNKTIRQIMIDIGEGLRASYGPDVWVAPVINTINSNPGKVFLIPGMRHPNEYSAIKPLGAFFIKVKSDFEEVAGPEEAEGLLESHDFHIVLRNIKDDITPMWKDIVNMVYRIDKQLIL